MRRFPVFETVALAVALVAIVGLTALQKQRAKPATETYSTYDAASGGYRAWFELLGREGMRASRYEERFAFLDRSTPALVIAQPPFGLDFALGLGPEDGELVAAWVRAGGRLLVVGASPLAGYAGSDLHLAPRADTGRANVAPFVARALARYGVRGASAGSGPRLQARKGDDVLLRDRRGILVSRHTLGSGEIVQALDGSLFRNAGIATPDRARLAYALAAIVAGARPIAFDETLHGYLTPEHWWQVFPRNFVAAVLLALAVLALAMLGTAVRLGPAQRLAPPPAPTSAEYLDAIAALTERARAAQAAIAQAVRSTRRVLGSRFGIADDAPAELVAERIERADLRAAFLELDALAANAKEDGLVRGLAIAYRLREEYASHAPGR